MQLDCMEYHVCTSKPLYVNTRSIVDEHEGGSQRYVVARPLLGILWVLVINL